jgi:hypothetical protein
MLNRLTLLIFSLTTALGLTGLTSTFTTGAAIRTNLPYDAQTSFALRR